MFGVFDLRLLSRCLFGGVAEVEENVFLEFLVGFKYVFSFKFNNSYFFVREFFDGVEKVFLYVEDVDR